MRMSERIARARPLLIHRYPNAFFPRGSAKRPLKLGIFQDIRAAVPELSYRDVKAMLTDYTGGYRYVTACTEGAVRVDLQGNPAGLVTKDEAEHAAAKARKLAFIKASREIAA